MIFLTISHFPAAGLPILSLEGFSEGSDGSLGDSPDAKRSKKWYALTQDFIKSVTRMSRVI